MPSRFAVIAAAVIAVGVVAGIAAVLLRTPSSTTPSVARGPSARDDLGAPAADAPDLGRTTYVRCQACHGLEGKGVPGNYPPLVGSPLLAAPDPGAAIRLVLSGATRSAKWNGYMPPFAEQLSDGEIAAVLTWTREKWGGAASPVTRSRVAAERGR